VSRKSLVPIQLPADPTNALEAATKQYVDGKVGAAPDVMWVGTSAPVDPNIEVWYDTDETAAATMDSVLRGYTNINSQTGTTYTLVISDAGALLILTNAAAITLTVPTFASVAFGVGNRIDIVQYGAGKVTVAGAGGVTVNATPSLSLRAQYSSASLVNMATNTWLLLGDLA
jgi:hypothetical protein